MVNVNPNPEQLELVRKNGNSIKDIENPAAEAQLAAMYKDSLAYIYIKNPCEEAKELHTFITLGAEDEHHN